MAHSVIQPGPVGLMDPREALTSRLEAIWRESEGAISDTETARNGAHPIGSLAGVKIGSPAGVVRRADW